MRHIIFMILAVALGGTSVVHAQGGDLPMSTGASGNSLPLQEGENQENTPEENMQCLLEPHIISDVGSPVEGTISRVLVDRGARVRAGQVIARLNDKVEVATLKLKRAQLDFDKRKLERYDDLFKHDLISSSDKDKLETATHLAALKVAEQQAIVDLRTIVSPISGVVVERYLVPGDHVSQGKIFKIAQINPLNVEVVAPKELFGSIKRGMRAEVQMEPLIHGVHKARVVIVDRVIDPASGTFGVRLLLRNPGNRIPAGLKCTVHFLNLDSTKKKAADKLQK